MLTWDDFLHSTLTFTLWQQYTTLRYKLYLVLYFSSTIDVGLRNYLVRLQDGFSNPHPLASVRIITIYSGWVVGLYNPKSISDYFTTTMGIEIRFWFELELSLHEMRWFPPLDFDFSPMTAIFNSQIQVISCPLFFFDNRCWFKELSSATTGWFLESTSTCVRENNYHIFWLVVGYNPKSISDYFITTMGIEIRFWFELELSLHEMRWFPPLDLYF